MKEKQIDTSLRIDLETRKKLDVISQREGETVKGCVKYMADFFVKNQIGFKDEYVPLSKEVDRIIKVLRAQEKAYFVPTLTTLNKVVLFQSQLITSASVIEAEQEQEQEEETPMNPEIHRISIDPGLESGYQNQIEKFKAANQSLIHKFKEIMAPERVTKKSGVGVNFAVIKLTEQEFKDLEQTIHICTIL